MPWSAFELTEEQLKLRLSWYFDRRFKEVGKSHIARVTGISRSTLDRYAAWKSYDGAEDRDEARVREGQRPLSKAQPDGPQKLTDILKICRALGVEFDQLIVALSRSTSPDSFEFIMRSSLVAQFTYTTAHNGEIEEHSHRTELRPSGRPQLRALV